MKKTTEDELEYTINNINELDIELDELENRCQALAIEIKIIEEVLQLDKYSSRLGESDQALYTHHLHEAGKSANTVFHLSAARRLLESAREWAL
jgi:chromosome segregation ATPase